METESQEQTNSSQDNNQPVLALVFNCTQVSKSTANYIDDISSSVSFNRDLAHLLIYTYLVYIP